MGRDQKAWLGRWVECGEEVTLAPEEGTEEGDRPIPRKMLFGRPFVKRFALCYWTVVMSVTLVYCSQTVGWSKMKLGMEVGLGSGHIVLDGEWGPSSPPESAQQLPSFRSISTVTTRSPISATAEHLFPLK